MTRSLEQHDLKAAIRRPARALGAEQDLINKVTAGA